MIPLAEFLDQAGALRSAWVAYPGLEAYLRLSQRSLVSPRPCLDMANVVAAVPGGGAYRRFIAELEREAAHRGWSMYIENVMAERFAEFHRRRGYTVVFSDGLTTCLARV